MVGLNDVTELAKWAWKIYHSASSEYTCANQEYQDFLNDIDTLQRALGALRDAAAGTNPANQPLSLSTSFVESIVHESRETTQACQHLLTRNPYFRRNRGALTNILWDVSVKEDVGKLQTRVQICFQKANFALTRQEVNNQEAAILLLAENQMFTHRALYRLLQQVADHVGVPPTLPTSTLLSDTMRLKFSSIQQSRQNDHVASITTRLDALIVFYERSTHTFSSQPPIMTVPPTIQYLNLLKCLYLMEDIKADPDFHKYTQKPMSDAWYRSNISKVDREAMRFLENDAEIQKVSDEELLKQIEDEFVLDLSYLQEDSVSTSLETNPNEDTIFKQWLVSRDRESAELLSVSRIGAGRLRLTRTISMTTQGHNAATRIYEQELDLQTFVLDPLYAASPQSAPNMVWRSASSDRLPHALQFVELKHALEFQRAVTNHVIVIDHTKLASARMIRDWRDGAGKVLAEAGRVQLWSYKDPLQFDSSISRRDSMATRSPISSGSSVADTIATFTQKSLNLPSGTLTLRSQQGVNELVRPVPYQIVIMTTIKDVRCLISVRVDENTTVNPDKCRCSERDSKCKEIFLEHARKELQLTMTYPCAGNGQIAWNLALFTEFDEISRHNDLRFAKEERARYVVLKFADVQARQEFGRKLERACLLMRERYNDYITTGNAIRGLATVNI